MAKVKPPKKKTPMQELQLKVLILEGDNVYLTEQLREAQRKMHGLATALAPFTFPREPMQFQGTDASFTACNLKDREVQHARQAYEMYK